MGPLSPELLEEQFVLRGLLPGLQGVGHNRLYVPRLAERGGTQQPGTELQGLAQVSHGSGASGCQWRKQIFLPYKALFGPEQLDGGQWT